MKENNQQTLQVLSILADFEYDVNAAEKKMEQKLTKAQQVALGQFRNIAIDITKDNLSRLKKEK